MKHTTWETYKAESSDIPNGIGEGFFCVNRINFDKLSALLQRKKGSGALMVAVISLARNMTQNNYIKRVNYSDLARFTNEMFTRQYYTKLKALDTLEECNIIARNDCNALMVNPKIAFATQFNENEINRLEKLYNYFKENGELNSSFTKK